MIRLPCTLQYFLRKSFFPQKIHMCHNSYITNLNILSCRHFTVGIKKPSTSKILHSNRLDLSLFYVRLKTTIPAWNSVQPLEQHSLEPSFKKVSSEFTFDFQEDFPNGRICPVKKREYDKSLASTEISCPLNEPTRKCLAIISNVIPKHLLKINRAHQCLWEN